MDGEHVTQERLAELLREAERAHGEYERQLGHRDDDWPTWYAGYIVAKLQRRAPDSGAAGANAPQA